MKVTSCNGMLAIDKSPGPTSHDVVAEVRRLYRCRAGHAGTLDPFASGLLIVLLGQATRLARFFQSSDKVYQATVKLGETTDTFDREGTVQHRTSVPRLSVGVLEEVLHTFTGPIEQIPPMFSAVRVNGERLYKKARRGETVAREPRKIHIFSLTLLDKTPELLQLRVHCSAGTYIRTLAHDLGQVLKCGAHLQSLRRLESGEAVVSDAVTVDHLRVPPQDGFTSMEGLLPHLPRIDLDEQQSSRARHGNAIPMAGSPGECRLFSEGRLIAIAEVRNGMAHPNPVFAPL